MQVEKNKNMGLKGDGGWGRLEMIERHNIIPFVKVGLALNSLVLNVELGDCKIKFELFYVV